MLTRARTMGIHHPRAIRKITWHAVLAPLAPCCASARPLTGPSAMFYAFPKLPLQMITPLTVLAASKICTPPFVVLLWRNRKNKEVPDHLITGRSRRVYLICTPEFYCDS